MHTSDIVNGLARSRGLKRYLEIATPSAGQLFGSIDPSVFETMHRMLYQCPEAFDDGAEITIRTAADSSHDLIRAMMAVMHDDHRYDLVSVDPYFSYAASLADMHGALCLLRPGGLLVVHHCNTVQPEAISVLQDGETWSDGTYQAFVDFVLAADIDRHCVVDVDDGCGVVFSRGAPVPPGLNLARPAQREIYAWCVASNQDEIRYPFFDRNRSALLNLVSPERFVEACSTCSMSDPRDAATAEPTEALPSTTLNSGAQDPALQARFTRVFADNQWLDPESISGPGSRLNSGPVQETLAVLRKICVECNIASLNDIPCGDLNWISRFLQEFSSMRYTGFDIVAPLLDRNRQVVPNVDCRLLDITSQVPPRADLVLCKDLMIHLDDENIVKTLDNIKRSGSEYLLLSNNFDRPNSDLLENIHGDSACRHVDILTAPFNYSPPVWRSQYLGLWRLADMTAPARAREPAEFRQLETRPA